MHPFVAHLVSVRDLQKTGMKPGAVNGITPVACKRATGFPAKRQIKRWRSQNVTIDSQKKTKEMYFLFSSFSTNCLVIDQENVDMLPKNSWSTILKNQKLQNPTDIIDSVSHEWVKLLSACLKPCAAYTGSIQRNQEKFRTSETKRPAQKCASVALIAAVTVVDLRSCIFY